MTFVYYETSMKQVTTVFLLGLVASAWSQCSNKSTSISHGSSTIRAPDNRNITEWCSWEFQLSDRSEILVINVTNIALFYKSSEWSAKKSKQFNKKFCSQNFSVGNYVIKGTDKLCKKVKPFCFVYSTVPSCATLLDTKDEFSECKFNGSGPVNVKFKSNGLSGHRMKETDPNYARGVDMKYMYIDCLRGTSTRSPTPPNSTMADNDQQEDSGNTTVIAVALSCVLLLFLTVLLVVVIRKKRSQPNNSDREQENEYEEFEAGQSAAPIHSAAFDVSNTQLTQADDLDQDAYDTIGAPSQSDIATYSTLYVNPVRNQSNRRIQEIDQPEYSALDYGPSSSQSNRPELNLQSEDAVYSVVRK